MARSILLVCATALLASVVAASDVVPAVMDPKPVTGGSKPVPRHVVNLDLEPKDRWVALAKEYKPQLKAVLNYVISKIPLGPDEKFLLEEALGVVDNVVPQPYQDEIKGLAAAAGATTFEIWLMTYFYELTAACTSVVASSCTHGILHSRNLDYNIPGLQNITVAVDFQRNGSTIYSGVTYVGYVGLLTGVRPGAFSVSVDERDTKNGTLIDNLMIALLDSAKGVGVFLRSTLEEQTSYEAALPILMNTPLIAPVYLIVGGMKGDEGAIIVRDRETPAGVVKIDSAAGRWWVLETNYDPWVKPPSSDNRRDPGNAHMNETTACAVTSQFMFDKVLNVYPNLNGMTTYTASMSAANGGLISAVTQNNPDVPH